MSHWCFVVYVNSKLFSGENMKGKERSITILVILKNVHSFIRWICSSKAESKFY